MRNGKGNGRKKSSLALVADASKIPVYFSTPPHLARTSWITHEAACAQAVYEDLSAELKALKKKVSEGHVHKARVSLRRWFSVWKVLRNDGWQTDRFKRKIGKPLKKLQKHLGALRDIDVNIELGQKLGVTQALCDEWNDERLGLEKRLEKFMKRVDINDLMGKLKRYLQNHARDLYATLPAAKAEQSAFQHIELFLLHQESLVRELAQSAQSPDEFHQLRLSIKSWRYLLTELFAVTNVELVRAQQVLGQMHDLDRLAPILAERDSEKVARQNLKERRKKLLEEIDQIRTRLPYGLRPQISSTKPLAPDNPSELRT